MHAARRRRLLAGRRPAALVTLALASAWAGAGAQRAFAEACPGSGLGPCPYASTLIIGQRAEGVLRFPEAVAVDGRGNVYVADQLSYVVQKFTANGEFESEWGSYGGGAGQFGPIGGLATDAAGNVYVVDSSHNRIEKFDPSGLFLNAWGHRGGALGEFSFGSSQDPTKPPGGGIAVAGSHVYVADSGNNRIERFALDGSEPLQWGTKGSAPGQMRYPRGVAANANEVLVADDDNHRIEKFDPNGAFEKAAGSHGTGPGQFGFPYGVSLDAAENAYVADDMNHRIVKLNPELGFIGAWGGFGSKPGQLAFPRALASGPAGTTYVADTANGRVQVFDPQGAYLRSFGASGRSLSVLTAPQGLAADPSGGLLVSDSIGNRIERFSPENDAFASAWTTAGGHRARFSKPAGIAVDPRGSVYVADRENERVLRLWGDGSFLAELGGPTAIGGAQFDGAGSVAVAPATGDVYVADTNHNRVLVYDPGGLLLARWGAGGGNGAAGSDAGQFNQPVAVAVAPSTAGAAAGDVFVADRANNRIVALSPSGATVRQWGSRGSGDGRFSSPAGVTVDGAGRVYVVDGENNRVQVFGSNGRFLAKWGYRGSEPGEFSQPTAIAVDCAGEVYVADTNNNRVQRFNLLSPAPTGCLAAADWPPPLNVAPVVRVSLARRVGVLARRALALTIGCARGCRVFVTAKLSPPGRRGAVKLIAAARALPGGLVGHVRLRIGPAALRRLRRELGPRTGMTARVRIVASGPTGRRTTLGRTYAVAR
jgi:DNA-binding beta-propeller fold protein YncE